LRDIKRQVSIIY